MLHALRSKICNARMLTVLALFAFASTSHAVGERGANDSCLQAQNLGALALPNVIDGTLGVDTATPDIDFFRIVEAPGKVVQVRLVGVNRGAGKLDPQVGVFDSECNLISQASFEALVRVQVPADGVLVLAATQAGDFSFVDGGFGGYRFELRGFPVAKAIRGTLINAVTRTPIAGPFSSGVDLYQCDATNCSFMTSSNIDNGGRFSFVTTPANNLFIVPGNYKVVGRADQYDFFRSGKLQSRRPSGPI